MWSSYIRFIQRKSLNPYIVKGLKCNSIVHVRDKPSTVYNMWVMTLSWRLDTTDSEPIVFIIRFGINMIWQDAKIIKVHTNGKLTHCACVHSALILSGKASKSTKRIIMGNICLGGGSCCKGDRSNGAGSYRGCHQGKSIDNPYLDPSPGKQSNIHKMSAFLLLCYELHVFVKC